MICLERIQIIGFKDPNRILDISLSKEPISVIFGQNGSGKTTLLRVLHGVFSRNNEILFRENIQRITLTINSESIVIERKPSQQVELFNGTEVPEGMGTILKDTYDWSQLENSCLNESTSILFGVNRGITIKNLSIDPEMIEMYIRRNNFNMFRNRSEIGAFSIDLARFLNRQSRRRTIHSKQSMPFSGNNVLIDNLEIHIVEEILVKRYQLAKNIISERVQKALFETLSIAINPDNHKGNVESIPDDFIHTLFNNRDSLIEALNNAAENTLRNEIINTLNSDDRMSLLMMDQEENRLLLNLLLKMIYELNNQQIILSSINILVECFNEQVSNNKKLVVNQDEAYILLSSGKKHSLMDLSSGERHLLCFLTIFLIEGNERNFLMIDEPEISLNLKWQKTILPLLNQLAPNSQILVASHSPSIAANLNYLVELKGW